MVPHVGGQHEGDQLFPEESLFRDGPVGDDVSVGVLSEDVEQFGTVHVLEDGLLAADDALETLLIDVELVIDSLVVQVGLMRRQFRFSRGAINILGEAWFREN